MSEASSPQRETSYKLRTHSNCNFMFSRTLLSPQPERLSILANNAMLLKNDQVIRNTPLLSILLKPNRKIQEGMMIFNQIKEIGFFQEFFNRSKMKNDPEQIYNLCSKLQLEIFKQGSIILKEGAISNNKMYVIIVGRILIFKKNSQFVKQASISINAKKTSFRTVMESDIIQNLIEKYGNIINDRNSGDYFGERALMENSKDAMRTATCIADTDSYLISLGRSEFYEVLGSFKQDIDKKLILFQNLIPYFDTIKSELIIENLLYSFSEEIKNRDETITQEDEEANTLYILFDGEVAIMKKHQNHQLLICSLHNEQIIGEESLFKDQYIYSIVVTSQSAKLFKISSQSFLLKGSPNCIKGLKEMMEKKQNIRTYLLNTIIKKSNEHRENQKLLLRDRNISQVENEFKQKYFGITNRGLKKIDNFSNNRGNSLFSSNLTNNQSQITLNQNSQGNEQKSLKDYALFQTKFEEKKQIRNCFKQSIQYQQLSNKIGIKQKTETSSPSKQDIDHTQQKDFSSRTDSIYTMNNKNSITSRSKTNLLQNYLQQSQVDVIRRKMVNKKKSYLIKQFKSMQDLQLIKIRCQTLEQ